MENRHHKSAPVIVVVITLRPGNNLKLHIVIHAISNNMATFNMIAFISGFHIVPFLKNDIHDMMPEVFKKIKSSPNVIRVIFPTISALIHNNS